MKRSPITRKTRVKPVNARRRKKNQLRAYGPPSRRAYVKTLPCAVCGVEGHSQNAHVDGTDGMGRKKDASTIAPLCGTRWEAMTMVVGCHYNWDNSAAFRELHGGKVRRVAENVDAAFAEYQAEAGATWQKRRSVGRASAASAGERVASSR